MLFVGFEFFDVPLFQNTDSHITYLFHQAIISQEYLISQLAIKKSTLLKNSNITPWSWFSSTIHNAMAF